MEQKQLDEIDEKYFGEEFIEEEIIDDPKPKEPDREKKESSKKLKVTKTTSKKSEMEVYYEDNNTPEIKITPAKERPPLETPTVIPPTVKVAVKETKEIKENKEPEKKKEEPTVKIEEPALKEEKKSSGWKWFFRIVIIIILIILIVKVAKYWGNDNVPLNINNTLPANLNTTLVQNNTELVAPQNNTKLNTSQINTKSNSTEFTIIAKPWLFEPNKIRVNKGEKIKFLLLNPKKMKFNFELKELGVYKEINAEMGTTIIEFTANKSGNFNFKCASCEAWRGMEGTLVVN